jgi:ribose transport system substrate-binding protein
MSRTWSGARLAVLGVAGVLALAACGGTSNTGNGDAKGGQSLSSLKMAYFIPGTNNSYVQTNVNAAKETAQKLGVKLDVISANWDSATQINQIQTATARKTYNAWVMSAVSPDQACAPVKAAMAQGIKVFVSNQGLCGNDTFTPGTQGFVGGQTRALYDKWFDYIVSKNPDGGEMAVLTGPNLNYNTTNALAALDAAVKKNPKLKVVSNQQSDYTTATAYSVAQATLQSHPNLKVFVSNYSEMTKGIVQAVKAAGKTGQVKVYDYGANQWTVDAIKAGDVDMSLPMLAYTEVQKSVELAVQAWQGKQVPQSYDLSKELTFPGAPLVTKENADQFKSQF